MTPKQDYSHRGVDESSIEVPLSVSCRIGRRSTTKASKTTTQKETEMIAALALRSYHLPGNSWWGDWFQYMTNNHPLIGICCHHRLHPIRPLMRLVALFGSFMFGLAITNMIFIWFVLHDEDGHEAVVSVNVGSNSTVVHGHVIHQRITVTNGMIALWTVGGTLHAWFDNSIWFIASCPCCLSKDHPTKASARRWDHWRQYGNSIVIMLVILATAVATLVVVLRATLDDDGSNSHGYVDDEIPVFNHQNNVRTRSLQFVIGYSVEMALALFVYYPIVGTLLFSGILGCGRLPLLGGRPREIQLEEQEQAQQQQQHA